METETGPTRDFKGNVFGVRLKDRAKDDRHQLFTILTEDDGYWSDSDVVGASTAYLDDLIQQLQAAKQYLERHGVQGKEERRWGGYRRKWGA